MKLPKWTEMSDEAKHDIGQLIFWSIVFGMVITGIAIFG